MEIFNIFSTIFLLFHQILNGGNGNVVNRNITNKTLTVGNATLNLANKNNNGEHRQQCGYTPYVDMKNIGKGTNKLKVINGDPVKDIRQFPWLVSMETNVIPFSPSSFICTGTIISRWHILTAGHCVGLYYFFHGHGYKNWPKLQTKSYLITAGVSNRTDVKSEGIQQIRSKWLIPHPKAAFGFEWPYLTAKDDIAIIELSEPLNFTDKVQPICLTADDQSAFNKIGIVAGWGQIVRNESVELDPQLHIGQMKIEQDACKNDRIFESKKQLCVISGNRKAQSLCHGGMESNKVGKATNNYYWTQIGITSMASVISPGVCRDPDILTRVSYYCDWIANATGMKLCI